MWKDEERTGGGVVSTSTRLGSICYVFVPHTWEEQHFIFISLIHSKVGRIHTLLDHVI